MYPHYIDHGEHSGGNQLPLYACIMMIQRHKLEKEIVRHRRLTRARGHLSVFCASPCIGEENAPSRMCAECVCPSVGRREGTCARCTRARHCTLSGPPPHVCARARRVCGACLESTRAPRECTIQNRAWVAHALIRGVRRYMRAVRARPPLDTRGSSTPVGHPRGTPIVCSRIVRA